MMCIDVKEHKMNPMSTTSPIKDSPQRPISTIQLSNKGGINPNKKKCC